MTYNLKAKKVEISPDSNLSQNVKITSLSDFEFWTLSILAIMAKFETSQKKYFFIMGLPAHDVVFIFFTSLTGIVMSSVFNSFQNAIFIFNKSGY